MQLRILSREDLLVALPMAAAIEGMKDAFAQLATNQVMAPLRARVDIHRRQGVSLIMPAYLMKSDDLAVKVVSVFPENVDRGEPTIYAMVLVLDSHSGRPLAIMEGGALTAIRTGAGSGAATDLLARPDASVVAIIGSGVQARTQLEAVCTVRQVREVRVFSPTQAHAAQFAADMQGTGPVPAAIHVTPDAETAVRGADIICTATPAREPVVAAGWLKPGAHINAVGGFTPEMHEVDTATIQRALVVVDSREAALAEAGELITPIRQGLITEEHIHAELGEVVVGLKPGRTSDEQITYFKSVGLAVQDVAAARIALEKAQALKLGVVVDL